MHHAETIHAENDSPNFSLQYDHSLHLFIGVAILTNS
jgi:hypothetical protein